VSASLDVSRPALVAAIVGLLGLVLGGWLGFAGNTFFPAYLVAFVFWTGLSLGALAFLAINHLAGGSWGAVTRRPLEAMVSALPLTALFAIPLFFGLSTLYPWANDAYVSAHPLVAHKAGYLNATWFVIRTVIYFAVWILMAWFYLRGARQQDEDAAAAGSIAYRMKGFGGLAIVAYVLTMTFASIDWGMSLNPEWWSGIYGLIFMISQAITAMALLIIMMTWLARRDPAVDRLLTWKRLQDLGNFLLGFTMFWAYVNISQLIIQWTNNIIETNTFYVLRFYTQPWQGMGLYLAAAGFALPFLILFSRWVKRQRAALGFMAGWALVNQAIHAYWYLAPEAGRLGLPLLVDALVFLGVGGVWLAIVLRSLASRTTIPVNDPRLAPPPVPARVRDHAPAAERGPEVHHA
jgi:hypothetical protein